VGSDGIFVKTNGANEDNISYWWRRSPRNIVGSIMHLTILGKI
jgi:hypothetical protein